MTIFTPFKKATGASTPDFSGAAYAQGRLQEDADAREDAANSGMLSSGVDVYNQFMGDDTPIRDYGRSLLGLDPAAEVATAGDLSAALAGTPMAGAGMAGTGAALTDAGIAGMAGSALPAGIAAPAAAILPELGSVGALTGAGATGAGAAGAGLAGLGPAGAALMLANLFGLFG